MDVSRRISRFRSEFCKHTESRIRSKFDESGYKAAPTQKSGVYVIWDEHGNLAYAGKAKYLRTRIRQHGTIYRLFNGCPNLTPFQKLLDLDLGVNAEIDLDSKIKRYTFSFVECREEERGFLEYLILTGLKPYMNSIGV